MIYFKHFLGRFQWVLVVSAVNDFVEIGAIFFSFLFVVEQNLSFCYWVDAVHFS